MQSDGQQLTKDAKREKIVGFLTYIEERLNELEEEKEELKEYQKSDKERRCLEYALHQRELEDVTQALDLVSPESCRKAFRSSPGRRGTTERHPQFEFKAKGVQSARSDCTGAKDPIGNVADAELIPGSRRGTQLRKARTLYHISIPAPV